MRQRDFKVLRYFPSASLAIGVEYWSSQNVFTKVVCRLSDVCQPVWPGDGRIYRDIDSSGEVM